VTFQRLRELLKKRFDGSGNKANPPVSPPAKV
jgi:hypothetical protein